MCFHSLNGTDWYAVDGGKVFTGNSNNSQVQRVRFGEPVLARCLRIKPLSWNEHASLRWEAYFLDEDSAKPRERDTAPESVGLSSLAGTWTGNWGGGPLSMTVDEEGNGSVELPGHANGTCKVSVQGPMINVEINRNDRLKQGFVGILCGERIVGTYVHFNCSAFSSMYLELRKNPTSY
uniref:F5/8 type C domain-containing protein n=1 Tax=Arcella intermedia TaxID=1963864 RepID=A0A6B2LEP5_9EUKA